ncbi:hypothetical protein MNV49_002181 [Pseudohyphozyma bogoriensis]|nr:hypothetical protein MNV49_002181 [Pseudohyphozyma bogoriensis]
MSSTTTYLISGASRGLGLETARQLLALSPSNQVIAAARNPETADGLKELVRANVGRIEVVKLDASDPESIKSGMAQVAKSALVGDGLDVLINNAGVSGKDGMATASQAPATNFEDIFKTNLYGAITLTQEALPLLRAGKGKKILTTSSSMGSIKIQYAGPAAVAYCTSKAAVNMFMAKLATELAEEKFTIIMHCPGWVKTDMNGGVDGPATLLVEDSVALTIKNVFNRGAEDNGKFIGHDGAEIPW